MSDQSRPRILRLAAEGAVIVLSILLAFAIDAAWAERQLRVEEREALAALEAEFIANLAQVDTVIGMHTGWLESTRMLVELPAEDIAALPQEIVSEIVLGAANPTTFDPVTGTTTSLMAAGKLGVLRDARLRDALSTFGNFVEDLTYDAELLFALAPAVWEGMVPHGGPWSDPSGEVGTAGTVEGLSFLEEATTQDLLSIRTDQELMGRIKYFHWNAGYYLVELRRIKTQISEVLQLIGESRG